MRVRLMLLCILLMLPTAMVLGLSFEAGAIGAGGLSFAYGSHVDTWEAAVSELGASTLSSLGASKTQLFPEWSAGVYGEVDFTDWIGVRLEPRWALLGFSRLGLTDANVVFQKYGLYFSSVLIPVLARGYLPVGPGSITATAGPFLGIVAGPISVVEKYPDAAATNISLDAGGVFLGLSGGLGYAMKIGPGTAALELRADWAFTPISADTLGDNLYAVGTTLMAGYGIPLGGIVP